MSNEDIMKYAPYFAVGFFVLMALIIIPVVMRSTRRKRQQANDFFPELAQQTGLTLSDDGLTGKYKGHDIHLKYSLSGNAVAAVKMFSSGNTNAYGKNALYPRLHVTITRSENFPKVALYETPGLLSHTSQRVHDAFTGKEPDYPKLEVQQSNIKKDIAVYAADAEAGGRLASSSELGRLLDTWKYTDIRTQGNKLILTLDNNSAPSTIGLQKMYTKEFAMQALDIAVAAADSLK